MCGIFGYVGEEAEVGQSVIQALKTLEFAGDTTHGA